MRWHKLTTKFAAWPESLGPGEEIPAASDVPVELPEPQVEGKAYRIEDSDRENPTIVRTQMPPNGYDVFASFEECKRQLLSELMAKAEKIQNRINELRRLKREEVRESWRPSDM